MRIQMAKMSLQREIMCNLQIFSLELNLLISASKLKFDTNANFKHELS